MIKHSNSIIWGCAYRNESWIILGQKLPRLGTSKSYLGMWQVSITTRGGWGWELSCGGNHQLRTDHHRVSFGRSSIWPSSNTGLCSTLSVNPNYIWGLTNLADYFVCGVNTTVVGLCWNCTSSVDHSLSPGCHIIAAWSFVSVLELSWITLDPLCKLIHSLFLQWFVNLLGGYRF